MFQNFYFNPSCLIHFSVWPFTFKIFNQKKKEEANMKIESNMKSQNIIYKNKMAKMKSITNLKS